MGKEIPNHETENYNVMRKMTADESAVLLNFFNLRDEHPEYVVIHYPNKTVYIHKWTRIPRAENDSADPRHPHYILVGTDEIGSVVARELQAAQRAFAEQKKEDIDKIEPIK